MSSLINWTALSKDVTAIIEIQAANQPTLYYSTRTGFYSKNDIAITVIPYVTSSMTIGYACNPHPVNNALFEQLEISGFSLLYNFNILYVVADYYGSKVTVRVATDSDVELNNMTIVSVGYISNISLTKDRTNITVESYLGFIDKDILPTFGSEVIPFCVGTGIYFGAKPITIDGNILHVISGGAFSITAIYDSDNNVVTAYTHVSYKDWTVIRLDEPTDSLLRVEGHNGVGDVSDLLKNLLSLGGFELDDSDKAALAALYPEQGHMQLFTQITIKQLLNVVLKSIGHVWYVDPISGKVRIKRFTDYANRDYEHTLTDSNIISKTAEISYFTRPESIYTLFYDLRWYNSQVTVLTKDYSTLWQHSPALQSEHPEIYSITRDPARAAELLDNYVKTYSFGLGIMTLQSTALFDQINVADTIYIDSDALSLHSKFFVAGIWFDFNTSLYTLQLVTI